MAGLPNIQPEMAALPQPEMAVLSVTKPTIAGLPFSQPEMAELPNTQPEMAELANTQPEMAGLRVTKPTIAGLPFTRPKLAELRVTKPTIVGLPFTQPVMDVHGTRQLRLKLDEEKRHLLKLSTMISKSSEWISRHNSDPINPPTTPPSHPVPRYRSVYEKSPKMTHYSEPPILKSQWSTVLQNSPNSRTQYCPAIEVQESAEIDSIWCNGVWSCAAETYSPSQIHSSRRSQKSTFPRIYDSQDNENEGAESLNFGSSQNLGHSKSEKKGRFVQSHPDFWNRNDPCDFDYALGSTRKQNSIFDKQIFEKSALSHAVDLRLEVMVHKVEGLVPYTDPSGSCFIQVD